MTDDEARALIAEARKTHREITEDDGGESGLMGMMRELCDALEERLDGR